MILLPPDIAMNPGSKAILLQTHHQVLHSLLPNAMEETEGHRAHRHDLVGEAGDALIRSPSL